MDDRSFRIKRDTHIRHGFQLFVFDRDDFGRVLRDRPARRHNSRDRFALPAGSLDCDRMLRGRLQAFQMGEHTNPWSNNRCKLFACHHGDDALHKFCDTGVDPDDLRMSMG